jgi:hypothetical protein
MKNVRVGLVFLFFYVLAFQASAADPNPVDGYRWSVEKANDWYAQQAWPVGFNYLPRSAINQLEMWQPESFDPETIDQELGWAADIGFNMARVYLHNLLWDQNKEDFVRRIDQFLDIADKHKISIMFVLLDDVWDPAPRLGAQRSPIPHTHNSGWLQAPGKAILGDLSRHDELEDYVRGIIKRYGNDPRVAVWDLYNEPGGANEKYYGTQELDNKRHYTLQLLRKVFNWARQENPSQPITSGIWKFEGERWAGQDDEHEMAGLYRFTVENSDIITFHSYGNVEKTSTAIEALQTYGRPMICTEYLARELGSTFKDITPLLVRQDVGAIHWGLVSGRSQTIYPWRSWYENFSGEPSPWFHDLLRPDGNAYDPIEVDFMRTLIQRSSER